MSYGPLVAILAASAVRFIMQALYYTVVAQGHWLEAMEKDKGRSYSKWNPGYSMPFCFLASFVTGLFSATGFWWLLGISQVTRITEVVVMAILVSLFFSMATVPHSIFECRPVKLIFVTACDALLYNVAQALVIHHML